MIFKVEKKSTQQLWQISISSLEKYGPTGQLIYLKFANIVHVLCTFYLLMLFPGIPIEIVLSILKAALEQTVIDPHSDEKAAAPSPDRASVDLFMNEKGVSLILKVPFGGFPVDYSFPLLPVARDPVELIEAQVRDAKDDIVYLKGLVKKQKAELYTLLTNRNPILLLQSSDATPYEVIQGQWTVLWDHIAYSSQGYETTYSLSTDKLSIIIQQDGLYQINTKIMNSSTRLDGQYPKTNAGGIYLNINDINIANSYNHYNDNLIKVNHNAFNGHSSIFEIISLKVGDKLSISFPANTTIKTMDMKDNTLSIQKID